MLIDAFIYGWEKDILEIRLHELAPVVDKFIIVESLEMHGSANLKTETLRAHWSIIKPFEDKVHYILLEDLKPAFDKTTSWLRENYHRNCLMPHIDEIARTGLDTVIISDCDEIPRAETLRRERPATLHSLSQDLFYYNTSNFIGLWNGSVIGSVESIKNAGGPQAVRNMRDSLPHLYNAGWHLSYFGGLDRIRKKLENFAHAQEDPCQILKYRSDEELAEDIRTGRDLYHRPEELRQPRRPDDSRLPKYLLENRDKFKHFEANNG